MTTDHEPDTGPDTGGTAAPGGLTILEALDAASGRGYDAQFSAQPDGDLFCVAGGHRVNAAAVHVEATWRVEGASDAADMNIVLALRCPRCSRTGTVVLGYGPNASAADMAAARHLVTEAATEPSPAPPQG